ncbi:MAG: aminoglycoside phosphotransferase family protein [Pseudomonadota bacterium]
MARAARDAWVVLASAVLINHGINADPSSARMGVGGTYPTVLVGPVVVKFLGGASTAPSAYRFERAAMDTLATAEGLVVPHLLGTGKAQGPDGADWPYLVLSRIAGADWRSAAPSLETRLDLARDLGHLLRAVHRLRPGAGVAQPLDTTGPGIIAAFAMSSLPERFRAEVPAFLAAHAFDDDLRFVHGDLMDLHVFIEDGRLSGVIDWGDAVIADRCFELAKLHLDLFEADKRLLAAFLEAYGWAPGPDFTIRCMVGALARQIHCVARHGGCDVFHKLPGRTDLDSPTSLCALGDHLFSL